MQNDHKIRGFKSLFNSPFTIIVLHRIILSLKCIVYSMYTIVISVWRHSKNLITLLILIYDCMLKKYLFSYQLVTLIFNFIIWLHLYTRLHSLWPILRSNLNLKLKILMYEAFLYPLQTYGITEFKSDVMLLQLIYKKSNLINP